MGNTQSTALVYTPLRTVAPDVEEEHPHQRSMENRLLSAASEAEFDALMDAGGDVNAMCTYDAGTIFHNLSPTRMMWALKYTPDMHVVDPEHKMNVLHHLCHVNWYRLDRTKESERAAAITAVLTLGADVNAADRDGNTPLHTLMSSLAPAALVQLLLANGADPTLRNLAGMTPYEWATKKEPGVQTLADAMGVVTTATRLARLETELDTLRNNVNWLRRNMPEAQRHNGNGTIEGGPLE